MILRRLVSPAIPNSLATLAIRGKVEHAGDKSFATARSSRTRGQRSRRWVLGISGPPHGRVESIRSTRPWTRTTASAIE